MTDLAALTLFRATREQTLECSKRTFTQWGRGLTFEQFLARDTFLTSSAHARDGKLVTWVLAPRNDPTTLDFLCSCDTYRRTVALSSPPGDAIGYGIASVFTPPQNRGKGYARHMMRLLHWVLAPPHTLPAFPSEWGAPPAKEVALGDAVISVLYSDVGREFYKSVGPAPGVLGWVVESPKSTVWDVPPHSSSNAEEKPQWKYLSREDCDAVWERDAQLIRQEVGKVGRLAFAFLPDAGVAATRVVRLVQFTPALEPVHPAGPWGVQLLPTTPAPDAGDLEYATWTTEPGETTDPKTLILTRIRASPASFPTLFAAICAHAQQEGYTTIEGWNVPNALATMEGGRTFERDDRLDAIKWYTKDEGAWLFNEQFCSL